MGGDKPGKSVMYLSVANGMVAFILRGGGVTLSMSSLTTSSAVTPCLRGGAATREWLYKTNRQRLAMWRRKEERVFGVAATLDLTRNDAAGGSWLRRRRLMSA
jgi:hypothetical protein